MMYKVDLLKKKKQRTRIRQPNRLHARSENRMQITDRKYTEDYTLECMRIT